MGYDYDVLVIGIASGASNREMGSRGSGAHRTAEPVTMQWRAVDGRLL